MRLRHSGTRETSCSRLRGLAAAGLVLVALAAVAASPVPAPPAETDLDAFMRQVLVRRDDNWKKLQQYILDEHEQIDVRGPDLRPLWGERPVLLVYPRRLLRPQSRPRQRREDRRGRSPQL